jgi:hypothetical protein
VRKEAPRNREPADGAVEVVAPEPPDSRVADDGGCPDESSSLQPANSPPKSTSETAHRRHTATITA